MCWGWCYPRGPSWEGHAYGRGEGASVQRFGGGHSRQRMASAKVLWWPGPAGLVGPCDVCGHMGPQA